MNRYRYLLPVLALLFFTACRQNQVPPGQKDFRDIVDQDVLKICDSIGHVPKDRMGWAADTLRSLSQRFTYSNDSATYALIVGVLGSRQGASGRYDSAIFYTEKSLPYFEKHPEFVKQQLRSYYVLGLNYKNIGENIFKANYYCTKAAAICLLPGGDTLFSPDKRSQVFYAAAETNSWCEQKEQSMYFARLGYQVALANRDSFPVVYMRAASELSNAYIVTGRLDSGKIFMDIAQKWSDSIVKDVRHARSITSRRCQYYFEKKQYDSSLKYALQIDWRDWGGQEFLGAYTELQLYTLLGKKAAAAKSLQECEQMLDSVDNDYDRTAYAYCKARYLALYGDRKETDRTIVQFDSLTKAFNDKERAKMFVSIGSEYNLADKQRNIDRLDNANKVAEERIRQKNNQLIIAVLGGLLFAVTVVVLLLLSRQRKLRSEKQLLEARHHKAELEQRLLRTQMEPHFIFNTLSVMQNFIRDNENEKAIRYLQQFAGLLRTSLENSRENYVPLSDEVEALENYISLQAMRFEDMFDYSLHLYDGYEHDMIMIPPMLLQPFVENAIYHGMRNVRYKGNLDIRISKKGNSLYCTITDNGTGMQQGTVTTGRKSLAVRIARERLDIASKETGHDASVAIHDRTDGESGVVVELLIPYKKG